MEWLNEDEYCELTGLHMSVIEEMVESGKLNSKVEHGVRMIDSAKGTTEVIIPEKLKELAQKNTHEMIVQPEFVEKTIGTIINLHEKVLDAKDETIEAVKVENVFLREALASLQELYDEDRKTIHTLQEQLKLSQEEVEFMRRKYKLMWNKAIDEHSK
jgi:polyhydroxyalkanoate synthesis regulator phasin